MAAPADGMKLPDAGSKLRMVLDYVPCEACLAHPVDDQDLLCSICARLDRQVAVRVATRTTVLLERPSAPVAPVVIAPASEPAPAAPEASAPAAKPIVVRFADDTLAPPGSIDVVVEPLAPLQLPTLAPLLAPVPLVAPEPEPDAEPVFEDDIVSFVPARDEFFDYRKPAAAPAYAPSPPPPAPVEERVPEALPPEPQDDFVFRPPDRDETFRAPEPEPVEEIVPAEEIPVEPAREELREQWAPPPDFLAEEEPAPPVEERPLETEVVQDAVFEMEEEILELEQVEDEPPAAREAYEPPAPEAVPEPGPVEDVLEMEVVEEDVAPILPPPVVRPPEPAPPAAPAAMAPAPAAPAPATGDLYRVRGIDHASIAALHSQGITEVAHLSGLDAAELAGRAGLPVSRVEAWIHVADLATEVGVPIDAANALVAAGIAGPSGLAEADADEVADRVAAFGGVAIAARDIKRWKRRS